MGMNVSGNRTSKTSQVTSAKSGSSSQPKVVTSALKYNNKVRETSKREYAAADSVHTFLKKPFGIRVADSYADKPWCAMFVSVVCKESGIRLKNSFMPRVSDFIDWAGSRYKKLSNPTATSVKGQFKDMHPGDFVIWKNKGRSHIGILVSVDQKTGKVEVMEGNAQNSSGTDKAIKKTYTAAQLASGGYSGYISNKGVAY